MTAADMQEDGLFGEYHTGKSFRLLSYSVPENTSFIRISFMKKMEYLFLVTVNQPFRVADFIDYWQATDPEMLSRFGNVLPRKTDGALYQKTALFLGDSISAGGTDTNFLYKTGWAGRIGVTNDMTFENCASSGASFSTKRGTNRILLHAAKATLPSYDYVIMQGGVNDSWDVAPIGTIAEGFLPPDDYDETTFVGALEEFFATMTEKYPTARLGFILNFKVGYKNVEGLKRMGVYFAKAKKVCQKWNIPYLNLYEDQKLNTMLDNTSKTYITDGTHPNGDGYDLLYPYIENRMTTLPVYSRDSAIELESYPTMEPPETVSFDSVSPDYLSAIGFTSTKMSKVDGLWAPVAEETDQPVAAHWFSGQKIDSSSTGNDSANTGLKPTAATTADVYLLTTPYTARHFEASAALYYGNTTGIVLGAKNTIPAAGDTNAVSIRMIRSSDTNHQIQIVGAVQPATMVKQGTTVASVYPSTGKQFIIYKPMKDVTYTTNGVYTLHVKVENRLLTVWVEGYDNVLTAKLADSYAGGGIALTSRGHFTTSGCFKLLTVKEILTEENPNRICFDNADITELEKQGYTSTKFTKTDGVYTAPAADTDRPMAEHWFTGADYTGATHTNPDLKPRGNGDNHRFLLNTHTGYRNFEAKLEVYWGFGSGLVFGTENQYAGSSSVRVNFANSRIQIVGAVDFASAYLSGANTNWWMAGTTGCYAFDTALSNDTLALDVPYSLNVRVKDGILTVWVDGYDGLLTVWLSETYEAGDIAMLSRGHQTDSGGLAAFTLTELSSDVFGDVSGDGRVDATDLAQLRKKLLFSQDGLDLNSDQVFDVKDFIALKKLLAGKAK